MLTAFFGRFIALHAKQAGSRAPFKRNRLPSYPIPHPSYTLARNDMATPSYIVCLCLVGTFCSKKLIVE